MFQNDPSYLKAEAKTGSGTRLQDAVRVPCDRTVSLLSQHLASKNPLPLSLNKQNPVPPRDLPSNPASAQDAYQHHNSYGSYPPPGDAPDGQGHANTSHNVYLPPPKSNLPSQPSSAYQNTPQYPYHPPYANSTSSYESPTYATTDGLAGTAAAANAYLNNYPPPPQPSNQHFMTANQPTFNNYHSPGSPTSWRNWAGNMASNLEPGADYINSASALMQLGGRSEGQPPQEMSQQPGMQPMAGAGGQMWPFMNF